jgi:hypothetical protein
LNISVKVTKAIPQYSPIRVFARETLKIAHCVKPIFNIDHVMSHFCS